MRSTQLGRPSLTLYTVSTSTSWAERKSAVPRVARISKPMALSSRARGSTPPLSKSFTLMKTDPVVGMT